jgi:hypothetical protein
MRVDDLREELGRRGQDTKGKKGELAARLEEHRRSDGGEDGAQTCSWRGRVRELAGHLALCGREEVGCPCPGCDERMARADVEQHVAASGAEHMRRAWEKVAGMEEKAVKMEEKVVKMEEKVAQQDSVIVKQKGEIALLKKEVTAQNSVFAGLERRAGALMRVFTWSTDSEWSKVASDSYTFTEGVVGSCYSELNTDDDYDFDDDEIHFIGFILEEGPVCTMHYKCSILDKNDKVLRVVSDLDYCDFREPPTETEGIGALFNLTDADKAAAARADGSIKLRMVVHLYLPE